MNEVPVKGDLREPASYLELEQDPTWAKVIAYLRSVTTFPESQARSGDTIYLQDETIRVVPSIVQLRSREEQVARRGFEAHRRDVDLQICFAGSEWIEWIPLEQVQESVEKAYDTGQDVALYKADRRGDQIGLNAGEFVILYPENAHLPGLRKDDDTVHKMVVKIDLSLIMD